MKKLMLIVAAVFCLSAVAVHAQDPQKKDTTQTQSQNYRQDMTVIKSTEIPATLRTTLQDAQYKGWETGTFYTNKAKDTYVVEIKDATTNKTMAYRFDASGKPIRE
jgi:nucleoside-specific outer membrane channel protein Tsx